MSTVPGTIPLNSAVDGNSPEKTGQTVPPQSWQRDLSCAVRSVSELLQYLQLDPQRWPIPEERVWLEHNAPLNFPVVVPRSFLNRMRPLDPADPLLRQVLPLAAESRMVPGFVSDAVGDLPARTAPGMLHKYHGRALLIAAGSCAIHCRYCFRRDYPYHSDPHRLDEWRPALHAIAADSSLTEIILSGGDPLMLSDTRLSALCRQLDQIDHVERIRIHSRMPIVHPCRVTPELLALPATLRSQMIMVVHANHPQEIAADCPAALRQLVAAGIPVLNQAVLLKGINDDVEVLAELCRRLINVGVLPYYLHQLDRVHGTAHFEVPTEVGHTLIARLTTMLPGYSVPRYVQEIPGADSKTPIGPGAAPLPMEK